MTPHKRSCFGVLFGLLFFTGVSAYAASSKIVYQGQLRELGVPVTSNKNMVFRIFTSSTGGSAAWASGTQSVSVISGLFRTLLQPTGLNWEGTLYLEVEVEGTTLSPREELTASPYSIDAQLLAGKAYTNSTTAPSSPSVGDLWFNTTAISLNVWSGLSWDQVSTGGSGGGSVIVENNDSVIETNASHIDFSGTYFSVTSGPGGEANVALSSGSISDVVISTSASIKLSKLEKDPSQSGTINTSTNPVDWSQLKNVPSAFADGVDNLGAGTPAVDENGVNVEPAAGTFNFLGAHFNVTSSPAGQANISVDGSSVTLQGNTFNTANKLVQLDGSGNLPPLSGANLTNISSGSVDGSSITKQGNTFNVANRLVLLNGSAQLPALSGINLTALTPANISSGSLPSNVMVSSIASGAVLDASIVSVISSKLTGPLPSNVIASSIAVNAVLDASVVSVSASKLTGTGTLPNATLDGSSVTLQGNTFNAANKLVLLNGSTQLPVASGANLTSLTPGNFSAGSLPNNVITSSIAVGSVLDASVVSVSASKLTGTGTLPNATLDASSVTLQGNTFNSANKLVLLDSSGRLVIGGGTPISKHLSGTGNLDFTAIGAGTCETQTITVTGVVTGDSVYLGLPTALATSDVWQTWTAYVSANDTVTVRRCNVDGRLAPGNLSNPASSTVRADVWQH